MFEELHGIVLSLIRDLYHPFDELEPLLRCFGEAALAVTESPGVEIALQASGSGDLRVSIGRDTRQSPVSSQGAVFPIRYQTGELGRLVVGSTSAVLGDMRTQACEWVARSLAYHLKRHEVREAAQRRLGREATLIGTSKPLTRVDQFVERASQTALPALLLGAPGSEVERIALALHILGPSGEDAFVQINCATLESSTFEQRILEALCQAREGTLLLAHLEGLEPRCQPLMEQILEIGPAAWVLQRSGGPAAVRLLATTATLADERGEPGKLSGALLEQLDFLRLELEPLRHRREDIQPLIEHHLRQYAGGRKLEVSPEVLSALVEYDWPGDLTELSRVMARIAVLTEEDVVTTAHLQLHAPQIFHDGTEAVTGAKAWPSPAAEWETSPERSLPERVPLASGPSHPTLQRVLRYIELHHQEKLSLEQVASRAFVSSSHLAHLFQQHLGTSFTRHLSALRIEQAKRLFRAQPWKSVTSVAVESGFLDLRHFERTFKGLVGCTPRDFRRIAGAGRIRGERI